MFPKKNVVFYRSDHHRQTTLLLKIIIFSYIGEKKPQHVKNILSVEILVKLSLCFSGIFLRIYIAYLVCVHPSVMKKKKKK